MKLFSIVLLLGTVFSNLAFASGFKYEVTVTNISKGVSFTPVLGVAHKPSIQLYSIGEPASEGLIRIAEGGDVSVLQEALSGVAYTNTTEGLLAPGESQTFELKAYPGAVFSMASMLLPTNDTIVALNKKRFPRRGLITYYAKAYDAGSEMNDEYCSSIPGPQCGGVPFSPEDLGEGYVYPSPGIHGEADLSRAAYNWQGAVAKVVIKRVW